MAFQVSPGVQIREFDLTAIVPAVSTTPAAYVGVFQWGPADQRVLVNTEKQLETIFRKPYNQPYYATSWLLASNFLSYGGNLQIVRNVKEYSSSDAENDLNSVSFVAFPPVAGNAPEQTNVRQGTVGYFEWRGINKGVYYVESGNADFVADQVNVVSSTATTGQDYQVANAIAVSRLVDVVLPGEGYEVLATSPKTFYFDYRGDGNENDILEELGLIISQCQAFAKQYDTIANTVTVAGAATAVDIVNKYVPYRGNTPYTSTNITNMESATWQHVISMYQNIFDALTTTYKSTFRSGGGIAQVQVKNREHYEAITLGDPAAAFANAFIGKYPGDLLNGLGVVVFTNSYLNESPFGNTGYSSNYPEWAREAFGVFNTLPTTTEQAAAYGFSGDEIHVAIVDLTGKVTGTANAVIEYFEGLSLASDAKRPDGTSNYWLSVINNRSQYVWVGDYLSEIQLSSSGLAWGTTFDGTTPGAFKTTINNLEPYGTVAFVMNQGEVAGATSYDSSDADLSARILNQYEVSFGDADESDVSILIGYNTTIPSDINSFVAIAEGRKDCIAFVSACYDLDLIGGTRTDILDGITGFVDDVSSTSYGAMDSGYKYQYDRFNNVYRYVPLCADSAGCAVRTDTQKDPWFSPAGYDRGRILNVVKLVFNPNKDERDVLYKKNVNPVITSQGFGVILFGDKTLQKKPSAFDRINVRRLFNVLEKSIATAAKFQLFEFNDAFTRSQFKQLVEPFLRDIQGRRGVTSYAVVCDESNNPPSIVDSNQFVADIFVAPNRSINFITLNFVATPTGVTFAEYGG
jgi:hypothetical protein